MKIAIFGTGGVGGYFGGLLARADHDVAFIARGQHLAAMRKNGLQVKSPHGDFHLKNIAATDDPAEVGPVEYLIVAVKHYQLQEAAGRMQPLINAQTIILPLLNGVDAHEILISSLRSHQVVGGFCSLSTMVEAPGVIRQASQLRRIVAGELDKRPGPRLAQIIAAWGDCGVDAVHSTDIFVDIWTKFLFIASFGSVSSLARASVGEILRVPQTRSLLVNAMREIEALARAQGIILAPDVVDETMKLLEGLEPTITSSMQRDVASGGPFELEAFSGKIVQLGRASNVPTPTYDLVDGLLRPAFLRSLEHD
ncbi:MAG: 2-dehydropantoate 2-reductase [Anaerolineales bacterium]